MATGLKYSFDNGAARVDPNPWSGRGSALGINLGDPARVLTVARKHGLLPASIVQVSKIFRCWPWLECATCFSIKVYCVCSLAVHTLCKEIGGLVSPSSHAPN